MFWFGRPPYLRWMAAAALVVGAALVEFWPTDQAAYPFTSVPVEAGEAPRVEWRLLPAGAFPRVSLEGMVASHAMTAGEPLAASDLRGPIAVPDGWWALALEVPIPLRTRHRHPPRPRRRRGRARCRSRRRTGDSFGTPTALIAVPGEDVAAVAAAASARQVVVLIAP